MKTTDKYIGLDVHKVYPPVAAPSATRDTTVIAVAEAGRQGDGVRSTKMAQP